MNDTKRRFRIERLEERIAPSKCYNPCYGGGSSRGKSSKGKSSKGKSSKGKSSKGKSSKGRRSGRGRRCR